MTSLENPFKSKTYERNTSLFVTVLLPADAEDSSEVLGLGDVKFLFLSLCHVPRFTAIEKH